VSDRHHAAPRRFPRIAERLEAPAGAAFWQPLLMQIASTDVTAGIRSTFDLSRSVEHEVVLPVVVDGPCGLESLVQ
jgi:hypothetical protein